MNIFVLIPVRSSTVSAMMLNIMPIGFLQLIEGDNKQIFIHYISRSFL